MSVSLAVVTHVRPARQSVSTRQLFPIGELDDEVAPPEPPPLVAPPVLPAPEAPPVELPSRRPPLALPPPLLLPHPDRVIAAAAPTAPKPKTSRNRMFTRKILSIRARGERRASLE